jgi:hypothetical protein
MGELVAFLRMITYRALAVAGLLLLGGGPAAEAAEAWVLWYNAAVKENGTWKMAAPLRVPELESL